MAEWIRFKVNADEIAERLQTQVGSIHGKLLEMVQMLSAQTHAFIIEKANKELTGWKLQHFLGEKNRNVRWQAVSENIFVVEIDESVRFIEEGRPPISMATEEWLLKGPGVKTAKDGSLYRSIPFTQTQGRGRSAVFQNPLPELERMVKQTLRANNISLHRIETDQEGKPKLGLLHRVKMPTPTERATVDSKQRNKDWFSKPRSQEMARLTGLKPHGGIFFGQDVVVRQREGSRGGIVREAITFRTVSSKHQAEGRWMYPAVQPLGAIEAAYRWAEQKWEEMVKDWEKSFEDER